MTPTVTVLPPFKIVNIITASLEQEQVITSYPYQLKKFLWLRTKLIRADVHHQGPQTVWVPSKIYFGQYSIPATANHDCISIFGAQNFYCHYLV